MLIRPHARPGDPPVRLGVPLLDDYLRFLAGRCRPNTVLAAAYDLKVFFSVVGKAPQNVAPGAVLAFVTAQRTGQPSIDGVLKPVSDDDETGVSLSTVRRRLSMVSGLYGFLQARGDVAANPVPRGLPTRHDREHYFGWQRQLRDSKAWQRGRTAAAREAAARVRAEGARRGLSSGSVAGEATRAARDAAEEYERTVPRPAFNGKHSVGLEYIDPSEQAGTKAGRALAKVRELAR